MHSKAFVMRRKRVHPHVSVIRCKWRYLQNPVILNEVRNLSEWGPRNEKPLLQKVDQLITRKALEKLLVLVHEFFKKLLFDLDQGVDLFLQRSSCHQF